MFHNNLIAHVPETAEGYVIYEATRNTSSFKVIHTREGYRVPMNDENFLGSVFHDLLVKVKSLEAQIQEWESECYDLQVKLEEVETSLVLANDTIEELRDELEFEANSKEQLYDEIDDLQTVLDSAQDRLAAYERG